MASKSLTESQLHQRLCRQGSLPSDRCGSIVGNISWLPGNHLSPQPWNLSWRLMPAPNQFHTVPFFISTCELSLSDVNQLFLDWIRYLEQHFSSFGFRWFMRPTFPIGKCTENLLLVSSFGVSGCHVTYELVGDHFLISNNPDIVARTKNIEITCLHIQLRTVIWNHMELALLNETSMWFLTWLGSNQRFNILRSLPTRLPAKLRG